MTTAALAAAPFLVVVAVDFFVVVVFFVVLQGGACGMWVYADLIPRADVAGSGDPSGLEELMGAVVLPTGRVDLVVPA